MPANENVGGCNMQNKKRLLIILISAVLVLAVGLTVLLTTVLKPSDDSSSSSASDSAGDVDYAEGKFYYEAEDENGQKVLIELELKKDLSYSLTVNGTATSGTYTKNGNRIELLEGGKTAYTLTDNGDTVEMTYDGYKVTLIADVTYTVSFAGAEGYNSLSIRNGKVIGEVADPTKEGYSFVGWYKNETFETRVYPSAYVVKSDVTLYARFSNTTAKGFKVKRYSMSGELLGEETVEVGKSLELADMGDNDFLGWWTSNSMDSGKLTAKVEKGTVLTEDTVLYAVYKSGYEEGAPVGVSASKNGVTWTAEASKNYDVTVTPPKGDAYATSKLVSGVGECAISFTEAGEYKIEVACDGKSTVVYYTNKLLARPSGLSVEGMLFSFAAVKDATAYYLTLNGKKISLGTNTYFDFSDYEMTKDGLKFIVEAHAAGYADSTSFEFELVRILNNVENIAYANGKLTWDAVDGAAQYEVTVNGKTAFAEDNEFDVSDLYGVLNVSVKAVAKGYYSESATAQINKEDLATPKGLNYYVKDGKEYVEWTKDDNAAGYGLKITGKKNGADKTVTETLGLNTTTYEIDASAFDANSALSFELVAKAASEANNSPATTLTVTYGEIKNIVYNGGKVTWAPVRNTAEYTVVLPDGTEAKTAKAEYASVTFDKAGENTIIVKAGAVSAEIKVTAYAITFATNSTTVPTLYHAYGDTVVLPDTELTRTGYDFAGWADAAGVRLGTSFVMEEKATVTLYAAWEPKEYTVTLDAGDYGKLEDGKNTVTVKYGKSDSVFLTPELNGVDNSKLFYGWYTQQSGQGTRLTDENGIMLRAYGSPYDATVYAHWVTAFEFVVAKTNEDGSAKSYSVKAGPEIDKFEDSAVTIPSTYNGKPVTLIESNAFYDCDFTVLNIPNSVYTIELISTDTGSAFSNCRYLEAINVYDVGELVLEQDKRYFSEDGVLYFEHETAVTNFKNTEVAYVPRGKEGTLVISDKVEVVPMGVLGSVDGTSTYSSHDFTEVEIPYSVTKIEDKAFVSNSRVLKVTFLAAPVGEQEQELTLGQLVFQGCTKLETIDFPARLATFDASVFDGCSKLASVNMAAASKNYSSIDGVVLNKNGDKLLYYPRGRAASEEHPEYAKYTTPESVTTICSNAFSGAKLEEIVIGKNVTMIEPYAFSGTSDGKAYSGLAGNYKGMSASGLTSIIFEDGGEMPLTIAEGAFYGSASGLTEITLPARLQTLGDYAFGAKSSLKTVTLESDSGSIQGGEFNYSNKAFISATIVNAAPYVTTLYLGKTVSADINIAGIFGSRNLTTVEIHKDNPYLISEEQVIYDKGKTTIVYYLDSKEGDYVIPDTVTEIKAGTFKQKDGLYKVTIHNGVTYIGDQAFYNAKNLAEVIMQEGGDAVLNLGDGVFENCYALTNAKLSTRIRTIGSKLFKGCRIMTEAEIPEGVTELGDEAFSGYSEYSYNAFETIKLPSTLEKMGEYETVDGKEVLKSISVFYNCTYLKEIIVGEGNKVFSTTDGILYANVYDSKFEKDVLQLVVCPAAKAGEVNVLPDVTKVWANAFNGNLETTKVVFADATMANYSLEIGENAFKGCKKLTELVLPVGLNEISTNTFKDCTSLVSVTVPYTVGTIAIEAFTNCSSLTTINFAETPEGKTEVGLEIADGTKSSDQYSTTVKSPFSNCAALTEIEFPERTTYVGNYVFSYNNAIKKVTFPATLSNMGINLFDSSKGIKEVVFKTHTEGENAGKTSLKTLPQSTFAFSTLEKITLPEGIEVIGYQAFGYCYSLTSISIPSTVKILGDKSTTYSSSEGWAFYGCTKLANVTFAPDSSLTTIGKDAFGKNCFESIEIPATVETIGDYAFENNKKLRTVTFLVDETDNCSALESIGKWAFKETAVEELILPETRKELKLATNLFQKCTELRKVHLSSKVAAITDVFQDCKSEFEITVAENNPYLKVHATLPLIINETKVTVEGVEKTLINIKFAYRQINQDVLEIPENCVAIEANAFAAQRAIKKLVLPSGIQTIADGAFHDCYSLAEVVFGLNENNESELQTLGSQKNSYGVFQNCYSLTKIVLPNNAINQTTAYSGGVLFDKTFYQCVSLEKIGVTPAHDKIGELDNGLYLPANLSALGTTTGRNGSSGMGVFHGCEALASVVLPASITALNDGTFAKCATLASITYEGAAAELGNVISNNVKVVGTYMFENCVSLETVKLPDGLTALSHSMFRGSGIRTITIPAKVTKIGATASASMVFQDATNLEEVIFQDASKVTLIGSGAFRNSGIRSIDISGATTLGSNLFYDCKNLTDVKLNDKLTETPTGLFQNCTSLTGVKMKEDGTVDYDENGDYQYTLNLPSNLIYLGNSAFKGSGLIAIKLPEGVKALCASASVAKKFTYSNYNVSADQFSGCTNLQSVIFASAPGLIGKNAFLDCASLTEILAPDSDANGELTVDGVFKGLIGLGDCAFKNSGVKKVTLNSLERVGKEIFMGSAVEEVYIGKDIRYSAKNTNGWGANMFAECKNLTGVKMNEDGTPYIDATTGDYVYTLSLPDGAIYFGTYTFKNTPIKALKFGAGLTQIGSSGSSATFTGTTGIFSGCTELEKVTFEGDNIQLCGQVFKGCEKLATVKGLEKAKYIGKNAFEGTALTELTFEKDVEFGDSAFKDCESLTKVTFSDKQTAIGSSAFFSCGKLTDFNLPDSIKTLAANCFGWAPIDGKTITLPKNLDTLGNGAFFGCKIVGYDIAADNANFAVKDGVLYNKDLSKVISIPAAMNAVDISGAKSIGSYAFAYCMFATIKMPAAIESIDDYAFASFTVPDGVAFALPEGMTEIPQGMFKGTKNLGNIVLPSTLKEIGKEAFMNAEFKSITFNSGLTEIGISAFEGATGLGDVVLPEGLVTVGNRSFFGSDVKSAVLPETVYKINYYAFQNCEQLTSVTFTDKLEEIGSQAFSGTGLTTVTIPKSVQELGDKAFAECKSLTEVIFEDGIERVGNLSYIKVVSPAQGKLESYSSTNSSFLNSAVATVVFPESVTEIANNMFQNNNIKNLTLPSGIVKIGASTFQGNPLTGKLVLPASLTTLGKNAFAGAERVAVTDEEGNETGEYTYEGCSTITEVVLPEGLATLEAGVFANLYNLSAINMENVQKFNGAYVIGYAGILNEKGLNITLSKLNSDVSGTTVHQLETDASIKKFGDGVFGYANIDKITFTKEDAVRGRLLHSLAKVPELVFPEGLDTLPNYFYAFCFAKEYVVPAFIKDLGGYTFDLCIYAEKISFAEGSVAETAGIYAFGECPLLKELTLPETFTTVGSWAFKFNKSLKTLRIPSKMTIDSKDVFAGFGADQTVYLTFNRADRYRYMAYGYDKGGSGAGQQCEAKFVFADDKQ